MNTNCSELLKIKLELYIYEMHAIIYPLNLTESQKCKYFPNVVAGCELPYPLRIWKLACNGEIEYYPTELQDIFHKKGRDLGLSHPAGTHGKPYTVGRCAEQRSCRSIFNALPQSERNVENFNGLRFSPAIEPRTFMQRDYCDNCKTLFS